MYMYTTYSTSQYKVIIQYMYMYMYTYSTSQYKVIIQYSNYSVVSFPHYSSSTVVLTVIDVPVNSTPQ